MTNLGFRLAMAEQGISVVETDGRRPLRARGARRAAASRSAASSRGHVIFRDLATTGDGLLTGVQLLDVMARTGRPLAELAGGR